MKQVTIAICNYNYEHYLAAAIDSALAQDYPATTVMIVDDGSTDGSRAIIESYGERVVALCKKMADRCPPTTMQLRRSAPSL